MKKTIKLLIGILLFAVVSANTAFAIDVYPDGYSSGEEIELDTSELQEIQVETDLAASATGAHTITVRTNHYSVQAKNEAGDSWQTLTGTYNSVLGEMEYVFSWTGYDDEVLVKITNDIGASNGQHIVGVILDGATNPTDISTIVVTTSIPEFPTIALPIAAILGLAFIFQRRKEEE